MSEIRDPEVERLLRANGQPTPAAKPDLSNLMIQLNVDQQDGHGLQPTMVPWPVALSLQIGELSQNVEAIRKLLEPLMQPSLVVEETEP